MTATPQHLVEVTEVELYDEARAWIADCTDQLPADCTDLTAPEVRALVAGNYTGGWDAFTDPLTHAHYLDRTR